MSDLFGQPFEEEDEPKPERRPERRILTVSELTAGIRALLESSFGDLWVEGEISNCRVWNGHLYFILKDGVAQIRAVMFRSTVRYLRFRAEDGLQVIARARIGVYEPRGEYQLVCEHLQPRGLGELQLAFDQLKKRLGAEGLFDASRKRPLPALPAKIGIVTSMDGAALRDIIKVLGRRHPTAHLVIRPARVQGEGAAAEVAEAIRAVVRVRGVDVVILARGGGSAEDLRAFNQEPVARAIANAPVPIVTGVGHEVDVTIADFVADMRAPTPSAAAEMVVAAKDEFCARIDRLAQRIAVASRSAVERRRSRLHALESRRGLAAMPARIALAGRHVAELSHQLRRALTALVARRERDYRAVAARLDTRDVRRTLPIVRSRLDAAVGRLRAAVRRSHERRLAGLGTLAARLESLSPLAVLARGYAVCWNRARTEILRRAADVPAGAHIRITLHEGELLCEVREELKSES